ncbi:MAG: PilZ domain-containing protein [Deltaproteobacteria bacterium]|nr:PilZ domain-containing protein [Deltaproteobacteria bacterium]
MADGKNKDDYTVLRSDKRAHLRKQILVIKVRGEDDKGVFFGYGKDISRGGMFITTVNPRKSGEEFDIAFKLAGEGIEVKCRCRVQWLREYDPKVKYEPGMGIQFLNIDNEAADKIEEWAKKQ